MPSLPQPLDANVRTLWRLAWPIILSNTSVPLLGLIATGIIGHLPDARYLAAVTVGVALFDVLFWSFGFLRMGTTGMTSQAYGQRDDTLMRQLLAQSIIIAAGIGALLIVLSPWLIAFGLHLLGGSSDVMPLAHRYAALRIWAAPAVLINYALLGWLLGRQQATSAMWITIANNVITIVCVIVLVAYWDNRSDGAAWATLVADYASLGLSAVLVSRQLNSMSGTLPIASLKKLSAYAESFRVSSNLLVRTACLLFAMSFFTAQGNRLGSTTLSANGVLLEFIMLVSFAMEGFAQATEMLTGQAAGAHDWKHFGAIVRTSARLALCISLLALVGFWLGGGWLIDRLTNLPEVRSTARLYLPWVTAMPLIAVWSYLFDGVFVSATDTRSMRDTLGLALLLYLLCWWLTRGYGNQGLWASFMLFMILRSSSLTLIYTHRRRGKWADGARHSRFK